MYDALLAQNAELLMWFKAAVMLAIVLGGGFSACFALWRRSEKEVDELREINRQLHADCDRFQEGHRVALATLAEERKPEFHDLTLEQTEEWPRLYAFHPEGHGQLSFFVCAESLNSARRLVTTHIKKNKVSAYEITGWHEDYTTIIHEFGEVAQNEND